MWILSLIPTAMLDFIVHAVLFLGVAGVAFSVLMPDKLLPIQKTAVQVISIVLIALSVYWKGGIAVEKEWRAKVDAAEQRAKIAEEKAATANAQIKYVFIDRVKTVKDVQVVVQEKIRDLSVKIDEQCKVIPEVIDIHNQAARNVGVKK